MFHIGETVITIVHKLCCTDWLFDKQIKNAGLFPVAIAIVDSENTTNWAWFLEHLTNVVNRQRTLTFVSDRHAGLLESIPITFPTAKHALCLQHLQRNLQDKLRYVNSSYRSVMLAKFRACAYAPTVAAFNQSMEEFTNCGRKVVPAFLKDLPPYYWANAYFQYVITSFLSLTHRTFLQFIFHVSLPIFLTNTFHPSSKAEVHGTVR